MLDLQSYYTYLTPNMGEKGDDTQLPLGLQLLQDGVYDNIRPTPPHPRTAVHQQRAVRVLGGCRTRLLDEGQQGKGVCWCVVVPPTGILSQMLY